MSKEYTEVIENSHPGYMKEQWKDHVKYLEKEMRKSLVKIAELEKKEQKQLDYINTSYPNMVTKATNSPL